MPDVAALPILAVSERGKKLGITQEEVDASLKLLAANGGKIKLTHEQLVEQGSDLTENQLRHWKKVGFPHRYLMIREELSRQIGESIAGKAFERALEADEVQAEYIKAAKAKVNSVPPEHLAKGVQALANAKASDIQMSQLLRDRPTQVTRIDVAETISVLERLGVVEKAEPVIEAEVVEESNA